MTLLSDAPARGKVTPPNPSDRFRTATVVATAGVLVVGLVAYFWTRSDLWLDEALSVNIARLPFGEMGHALRHDGAPPLYYALLHVWTSAVGTGDRAVRALSGLCMVGATVALWFAARRVGGTVAAWAAALLTLSSPYAVRYATETRMYALEILLVSLGILAFRRALESPSAGRLVVLGAIAALLMYTQYWALYLLLVVGVLLVVLASRGPNQRSARRMLLAMAVAAIAFVPWLPSFLYQRAHTGTPWGIPQLPGIPIGYTLRDFAGGNVQEGWLLLLPLLGLLFLGLFGAAAEPGADDDPRHIELDLRTQPGARWEAIVGGATLLVALVLTYLAGGAFESRYSAVVFPFFVIIVARGVTTFRDPRVRAGVLAVVVALGLVGAARNVLTNRTEAGRVAALLRARAKPADLVVYCPDQLGPAVHRLAPSYVREVTYPRFLPPEFVDWVDYKAVIERADPVAFVRQALQRAGDHTIWYVSSPGYITHAAVCGAVSDLLAGHRARLDVVVPDEHLYEHPGLQEFRAPARTRG